MATLGREEAVDDRKRRSAADSLPSNELMTSHVVRRRKKREMKQSDGAHSCPQYQRRGFELSASRSQKRSGGGETAASAVLTVNWTGGQGRVLGVEVGRSSSSQLRACGSTCQTSQTLLGCFLFQVASRLSCSDAVDWLHFSPFISLLAAARRNVSFLGMSIWCFASVATDKSCGNSKNSARC